MRRDKEAEAAFSRYVTDLRTKQNITLEKLCEGLCTPSNLLYLETGKKGLSKHLQDRILERLGVGAEDFSYMLGYEEYDCWHLRTKVLYAICRGECDQARELLKTYVETYGDENPLERQFYLRMKAMILQYERGDSREIHALLDEALKLTVPAVDKTSLCDLVLSIQELDMLADRAKYSGKEEEATYLAIIEYTRHRAFDSRGVSKILPKAVVYLYEEKRQNGIETLSIQEQMELLDLFGDALEIQRNNCSLYYLWELLFYRNELFHLLEDRLKNSWEEFVQKQQENEKWLETIEWLYDVTGFHKETRESSNVYFVKGVECVNDVIRTRRKMLGISAIQLCEGICDVRTLRRIEKRKGTPQRLLAGELLERLGLPKEYVKNDMVVQDPEEKSLTESLFKALNQFDFEQAEIIVTEIQEKNYVRNVYNQQFLFSCENMFCLQKGKIAGTTYCKNVKKILSLTIPWSRLFEAKEFYFTDNEIKYLHDYISVVERDSKDYWECIKV
ncbi:MAG: helix-turn-helix domain-containing protein, partial [Lachnospiraceae bacterium]